MKKKLYAFGLAATCLWTHVAVAEHKAIDRDIKTHKLISYFDSEYFKNHPKELAYEECRIYFYGRHLHDAFIKGDTSYKNDQPTLFCVSFKLGTAFKVAVEVKLDHQFGLDAGISDTSRKIRVRNLKHRTLADLFAPYRGVELAVRIGVSLGGSALRRHGDINDIWLTTRDWGVGFAVAARSMELNMRVPERDEILSRDYLDAKIKDREKMSDQFKYDRFWVHMAKVENGKAPSDLENMDYYKDLNFTKIKNRDFKFWKKDFWKKRVKRKLRDAVDPDF